MHVSTFVLLVTSPLNVLLSYLLVHKTSFGFIGAPIAISITYFLSFFLIVLYARYGPGPPPEPEPSETQEEPESITRDASPAASSAHSTDSSSTAVQNLFSNFLMSSITKSPRTSLTVRQVLSPAALWSFTRLALPGILMVATEWWAFEIVALAAGRLGRLPLAAQGVVMTADQSMSFSDPSSKVPLFDPKDYSFKHPSFWTFCISIRTYREFDWLEKTTPCQAFSSHRRVFECVSRCHGDDRPSNRERGRFKALRQ